jgi:tryptophan 2,3-dioxygenase
LVKRYSYAKLTKRTSSSDVMTGTPLTYWDYIKLDTIQALQSEHQTDCYDEIMFIAVHQHFEFWFAQVIRDLREIIRRLRLTPPEIASGTALLHRCNIEFRLATQGFEVLKTLPRESFLAFRAALQHASGLQSVQFTIIELLVGRTAEQLYHHLIRGPGMRDFLDKYGGPDSLLARVLREVERTGNLRQNYDRLASFTASDQLSALEQELVTLDRQLFDWRRHHAETAAHVLGGDFSKSAGTVGNLHSCRDNLEIGKRHTQRYFADLEAKLASMRDISS